MNTGTSFSAGLKSELLEKPIRARLKKSRAYGLFAFSRSFSSEAVELATENFGVLGLFEGYLREFLGDRIEISVHERARNGKIVYHAALLGESGRRRITEIFGHRENRLNPGFLVTPAHVQAFLGGVYLACGNITDPEKSYHIEFVVKNETLMDELAALLDSCLSGVKRTRRRGAHVAYYKEYAQIEDLLTMMGAVRSTLAMIEIEMIKSMRNSANRATNCETANIDKLVNAAANQLGDIRLVLERVGQNDLPEELAAAALLRLEHPEASLRELAALAQPPMSRSGIYHRLERLSKMAAAIREEKK